MVPHVNRLDCNARNEHVRCTRPDTGTRAGPSPAFFFKHVFSFKKSRRCDDNQQITVSHFGEHKRLHLESSKQNYYIISLWEIIKAIFTSDCSYAHMYTTKHTQRDLRAQPCMLYSRLVQVCTHARTHIFTRTRTRCTHACTHARTHSTHARMHSTLTYTQMPSRTHTHTHTQTHTAPWDIGLGMTSNGGSRTRLTRLRVWNRYWWVIRHYFFSFSLFLGWKINFWF